MIVDTAVEHAWLMPLALAVFVVVGALAARWLTGRPRLVRWLAGAALLPVLAVTLVPDDRRLDGRCAWQWSLPLPGRAELLANVVLFVPPVFLVAIATRRPMRAFVVASMFSAVIEVTQATLTGLGRSCDTNDWSSNTLGAAIGALVAWTATFSQPTPGVDVDVGGRQRSQHEHHLSGPT
jgi:hypothetical protein